MKIIVSPSKTMQFDDVDLNGEKPMFFDRTKEILSQLKSLSKERLGEMYKIKDNMLERVYCNILHFEELGENIAIKAYTGLAFKGLALDLYNDNNWKYLNENVLILSSFYGILKPNTLIKHYRLDFNCLSDLYSTWNDIGDYIDDFVINLASNEFSKMINKEMINVGFRDFSDGKYKNVSTYSKQARGSMLNYLILNNVQDVEGIKLFNERGYSYSYEMSDEYNLIFIRKK